MGVYRGAYLLDVGALVDADGVEGDTRLPLPVGIDLLDSVKLTEAGLAPRAEERHDEGLARLEEGGGLDGLTAEVSHGSLGEILSVAECRHE